jgi:peptidyl-dipeptidase A
MKQMKALRREAWEGSKEVGAPRRSSIRELAHRRNAIAQRLGYRDHYAFSLARQEIDEVALFSAVRATGAGNRRTVYRGERGGRCAAARTPGTDRRRPAAAVALRRSLFPGGAAGLRDVDLNQLFADVDVAELSEPGIRPDGLEVDDILARSDLYEREGKNQHAFCIRIDREGDTRILCNLRPTCAG